VLSRVPGDVMGRDVALAALWHLLVEHARRGLLVEDRTVRHTLSGSGPVSARRTSGRRWVSCGAMV